MTRVKRGNVARKRRKKVLQMAKGFRGSSSSLFRTANQQNIKALKYSYRDRAKKKRDFRQIWITRINSAARELGLTYSEFIFQLKKSNLIFNRKTLAQLSILDNNSFSQLITRK